MFTTRSIAVGLLLLAHVVPLHADQNIAAGVSLKIVVIEGEGAVNVIQQRSAVNPVVEVRDANNQPIAGASVRFAIQGARASFSGARTITVTTNAAGRAVATGLTPTSNGTFTISVTASFQGQTAVATIAATNVATAAGAAGAATAGVATAGATTAATAASVAAGSAGAAGGGLSAMTIGIVSAAAGGGALLTTKALDIGPLGSSGKQYTGAFDGQLVLTTNGVSSGTGYTCVSTRSVSGTLRLELDEKNGTVSGRADADASQPEISRSGGAFCGVGSGGTTTWGFTEAVTGTGQNVAVTTSRSSSVVGAGATNDQTQTLTFSGILTGGVVSGTLTYSQTFTQVQSQASLTESGSVAMPVTLRE